MNTRILISGFVLLEGTAFGIAAAIVYLKQQAKLSHWQRTAGEVADVVEKPGRNGRTRHPVIRFITLGGPTVIFTSNFGRSGWKIKAGDRIDVYYNPNKTSEAEPVYFMAQMFFPFVLGIAAVSSLTGAFVLYSVLKP